MELFRLQDVCVGTAGLVGRFKVVHESGLHAEQQDC